MVATSGDYRGKHFKSRVHRPANIYWEILIKISLKISLAFRHVLKIYLSFQSSFVEVLVIVLVKSPVISVTVWEGVDLLRQM